MIPVKQRIRHAPTAGAFGDCHRACMASILELVYEEVPHFADGWPSSEEFARREREFLLGLGFVPIVTGYIADSLDRVLACLAVTNPDNYYILGGGTAAGTGHSVVGLNDRIVHNPGSAQIIGPLDDGLYLVTFIGSTISVHHESAERVGRQAQGGGEDDPRQDN